MAKSIDITRFFLCLIQCSIGGDICKYTHTKGGEYMTDGKELLARCERFMSELGISKTAFCSRIELSTNGYFAWRAGTLKLSEATLRRIDGYLQKYNF